SDDLAQCITTEPETPLASGFYLSTQLVFADQTQTLTLPLTASSQSESKVASSTPTLNTPKTPTPNTLSPTPTPETPPSSSSTTTSTDDAITWLDLNKTLGPLSLQQVGLQFADSELWVFLNASLSLGGITLACNNLGVGNPLNSFSPKFRLDGLSLAYSSGSDLEIGGAFLRKTYNPGTPKEYDEYSGAALLGINLKGKKLGLTAIGSYTEINGQASLFIFALLEYPLGGPPFLFVTGLAAGFGYNRRLNPPETPAAVERFPLVKLAMGNSTKGGDPLSILATLGPYLEPAAGELFFAVGIKFTSFELVKGFLLLIVKLGRRTEIHLLGLANLVAPPDVSALGIDPVAEAKLALRAVFIPETGELKVEAVLTEGSYILAKDCKLSGGFAFYSWFAGEHEDDFVLTLGGYHPKFRVPSHYPQVPRLKLEWKLDNNLSVKGEGYFALTATALMAGGLLEATYCKGDIKASFKLDAHFLIAWQPFYYQASIAIEISASAKILGATISVNLGATIQIWGPPFSGQASLKIGPVSVTIRFGSSSKPKPTPLDWDKFKGSLLPAKNEVCSISATNGLIRTIEIGAEEEWIINPKEFAIITNSAIPATKTNINFPAQSNRAATAIAKESWNQDIGIPAMGLPASKLEITHTIEIKIDNRVVNNEFSFEPIFKRVPTALWGKVPMPKPPNKEDFVFIPDDPNAARFVENALCGFEIKPAQPPAASESQSIDYKKLIFDSAILGGSYQWQAIEFSQPDVEQNRQTSALEQVLNNAQRTQLLQDLGFSEADITVDDALVAEFLGEPLLVNSH
ncbi:MAG: hypothetical protein F6J87_22820, partial [Spirulina sp. SIO3F2]|nr:hypothetical protein [Spirulina sp. SIO3F2]